jgi:hypothetical protein
MHCMRSARSAKLLERKLIGGFFLVLRRRVILSLTLVASKPDNISHECAPLPKLLDDLCDDPGANGPTALSNCKL